MDNLSVLVVVFPLSLLVGSYGVSVFPAYSEITTPAKEAVKLSCELKTSCQDKPQITWFKGKPGIGPIVLKVNTAGKVYTSPNYTNHVRLDGQANLVIISPELSDSGNYSCEALITVDVPPIDAGYVFLNVHKLKEDTTRISEDYVGLSLVILDTVAVLSGVMSLFVWGKSAFLGPPSSCVYTNLTWMGLCLVSSTILWIHYTLIHSNIYRDSMRTVGVVISVLSCLICISCHIHNFRMWVKHRKEKQNRKAEVKENTQPMLKVFVPVQKTMPDVIHSSHSIYPMTEKVEILIFPLCQVIPL